MRAIPHLPTPSHLLRCLAGRYLKMELQSLFLSPEKRVRGAIKACDRALMHLSLSLSCSEGEGEGEGEQYQ